MAAAILSAGAASLRASPAHAGDSTEAEDLIREGIALRRAGNDSRALPLLQKAHSLAHTPRTAAQLGLVEFALGYALEAELHLTQGLGTPTDSWIGRNRAVLEDALTRVKTTIGEIAVTGTPVGGEVLLNGRTVGRIPLAAPIRVGQGPVSVELRASGYASASQSVEVVGGKTQQLAFHLEPARDVSFRPPIPAPTPDSSGGPVVHDSDQPASQASNRGKRTILGWSLVGAGAALAAGGAIWAGSTGEGCTAMAGFECSRGASSRTPGWVLLGAGVATGVAGGLILLTRPAAQVEVGLGPMSVFLRAHL